MATLLKSWLKAKPNATRRQVKIAYTPRIPTDATEHRPFFMCHLFPSLCSIFSFSLRFFSLFLSSPPSSLLVPCSPSPWPFGTCFYFTLGYFLCPSNIWFPTHPARLEGICVPCHACACMCVCVCKWLSACKTAHSAGQLNSSTNWIFMILFFMALSLLTELTQGGEGPQEY